MINRFLRIILTAVICLSLAGKVLSVDSCQAESSSENSVVSSQTSNSDCADIDCQCHCHHHHFDFAALTEVFLTTKAESEIIAFDPTLPSPSLNSSQKRPPKLVA